KPFSCVSRSSPAGVGRDDNPGDVRPERLSVDAKLCDMTDEVVADPPESSRRPDIDENGVDLAQIRAMLDRKPGERLSLVAQFINSLAAARARNGTRGSS